MFQQLLAEFDDRVKEVDLYFRLLESMDNDELSIIDGSGPQVVPVGSPPSNWGRMLKGASYLVLYNLVEAFVRKGFQAMFDIIKGDGLCATELTNELRAQWVEQKNRRVKHFDGSPKVYIEIAHQLLDDIMERQVAALSRNHLPVSGNLDADKIREVCKLHGVDGTVDPRAKGGAALEIVKKKRNSLSHGDESFVEVGRNVSANDLITAKDETTAFLRSVLQNLEKFAKSRAYRRVPPPPSRKARSRPSDVVTRFRRNQM